MNMADLVTKISRPVVLALISVSLILIAGCKGQDEGPFGTSISIEELGSAVTDPNDPTKKQQTYRVTVIDTEGFPMNGIKVHVFGTYEGGGLTLDGLPVTPVFRVDKETGNWGVLDLVLSAPSTTLATGTTDPFISNVTGTVTGGNITTGTYTYAVTAIDYKDGQSNYSNLVSAPTATTDPTNSFVVTWGSIAGATSYNVYRDSGGGLGLEFRANVTGTTWTDTGAAEAPPTVNARGSFGTIANNISGEITVTTGISQASIDLLF